MTFLERVNPISIWNGVATTGILWGESSTPAREVPCPEVVISGDVAQLRYGFTSHFDRNRCIVLICEARQRLPSYSIGERKDRDRARMDLAFKQPCGCRCISASERDSTCIQTSETQNDSRS